MTSENGKPRRRKLSEEERELWGRMTRSVVPLRRTPAPAPPSDGGSTADKPTRSASAVAHETPRDAAARPKAALRLEPLDRRLKQRLARGAVEITARIDLHGKSQSAAYLALLRFLRRAQDDGVKFVLVITGKGGRAGGDGSADGVLKRQVPLWLNLPEFRAYVLGFEGAHLSHGGEGALYVRVRRVRPR